METIVYRKTLDVHKNGIQFTLQGFETADNMARRIEISLMASGDTIDLPLEQMVAMMYVTTPNATEPSINECTIKGNTIIYDVLPIVEPGITEMQLKLIETRPDGANGVLASPKFGAEVSESNTDEESATQTTTYTALEGAIAKANGVYESRLIRIELDSDCMFRAYYADGTMYESDVLKELFLKGDALLSQSFAKGGTGVRAGEDTDNSMYYSNVSKSASEDTKKINDESKEVLEEVMKHGVYTAFSVDFETGNVEYVSPSYTFKINSNNGQLDAFGETYTFEESVNEIVSKWLIENGVNISELQEATDSNTSVISSLSELTSAHSDDISGLKETSNSHNAKIEALETKAEDLDETIENVSETVEEHTTTLRNIMVDYIVAQGEKDVNGIVWTYERWASGKFTCIAAIQFRGGQVHNPTYAPHITETLRYVSFPTEFEFTSAPIIFTSYNYRSPSHTDSENYPMAVKTGASNITTVGAYIALEQPYPENISLSMDESFVVVEVRGRVKSAS